MEIGGPVGHQLPGSIDPGVEQGRERHPVRDPPIVGDPIDRARAAINGKSGQRGHRLPRVERERERRRLGGVACDVELSDPDAVETFDGCERIAPGGTVGRVFDAGVAFEPGHGQPPVARHAVVLAPPGVVDEGHARRCRRCRIREPTTDDEGVPTVGGRTGDTDAVDATGSRHAEIDRPTIAAGIGGTDRDHAPVWPDQFHRQPGGRLHLRGHHVDCYRLAGRNRERVVIGAGRIDLADDREAIALLRDWNARRVDRLGRGRGVVAVDDRRDADHVDHRGPVAPAETLEVQRRRRRGGDEPERVPRPIEAELRPRTTGVFVRHPRDGRTQRAFETGRPVEERDFVPGPGNGHERLGDASPQGAAIERQIDRVHPAVGGVQSEMSRLTGDQVPVDAVASHDPPGDRVVRLVATGKRADPLETTVVGDRVVAEFERSVDDQIRRRVDVFLLDRGIDDDTEVVAPASLRPDHADRGEARGRCTRRLEEGPLPGRRRLGGCDDRDPIGGDKLDANALTRAPGDHGADNLPGSHVNEPGVDLAGPDDRSRRAGGRHARRHRHEYERRPEGELEARRRRDIPRRVGLPDEQAVEALDGSERPHPLLTAIDRVLGGRPCLGADDRQRPVGGDAIGGTAAGIVGKRYPERGGSLRVERELEARRGGHTPQDVRLPNEHAVGALDGGERAAPGRAGVDRVLDPIPRRHPGHGQRAAGRDPVCGARTGVIPERNDRGIDHAGEDRIDDRHAMIDVFVVGIRADEVPEVEIGAWIGMSRPLEIQATRQVFTVDTRGGPGGGMGLPVVGRDIGGDVDRRGRLLDGERAVPRRIGVVGIRAEKQPCHRVNACVRDGFVGEGEAECLPFDATAEDDTPLPKAVVDHGRRSLE